MPGTSTEKRCRRPLERKIRAEGKFGFILTINRKRETQGRRETDPVRREGENKTGLGQIKKKKRCGQGVSPKRSALKTGGGKRKKRKVLDTRKGGGAP